MTDYEAILRLLQEHRVEFIVVGGVAAIMHGSARFTQDVDVVYRRTAENLQRLERSLASHAPYLRGAPPGLPFHWDADTIRRGLNFTLTTDLGSLDLLGEIAGGGTYDKILPASIEKRLYGIRVLCLDLEPLIQAKRAAGRPKDLEAIAELEALLEETRKRNSSTG
jgi:predicted nucleotidyltransferase